MDAGVRHASVLTAGILAFARLGGAAYTVDMRSTGESGSPAGPVPPEADHVC